MYWSSACKTEQWKESTSKFCCNQIHGAKISRKKIFEWKKDLLHSHKLHNISQKLVKTLKTEHTPWLTPKNKKEKDYFQHELSPCPIYSNNPEGPDDHWPILFYVPGGTWHIQSDGLYFEAGIFSCPLAEPPTVITFTDVFPVRSRRATVPAPDLVITFCCMLDFGFRIFLNDRGNIGPSFSDNSITIMPNTISVLQKYTMYNFLHTTSENM